MLCELYSMMNSKGYCSDLLYRDNDRPDRLSIRAAGNRWNTAPRPRSTRKCTVTGSNFQPLYNPDGVRKSGDDVREQTIAFLI